MNELKLSIIFEKPFWIGLFEFENSNCYEVAKITFGAEPKDGEILDFICKNFYKLNFSSQSTNQISKPKKINPKKQQRDIQKICRPKGIGTKAQEALKKQHEENKAIRKKNKKNAKDHHKQYIYDLKQKKKKQKKKGH
ncbi:MAG: YjdF family protein [Tissierellales bacterium]|jgi:hypothetical protein|nr:YjdF family protein [Tissierellales bacterium]